MTTGISRILRQNERFKLAKKASTRALCGVFAALSALVLLLQGWTVTAHRRNESDWQAIYTDRRNEFAAWAASEENPADSRYENGERDKYQYLLDHAISPSHWKYGLVLAYYEALDYYQYSIESDPDWDTMSPEEQADASATLRRYERLMAADDWREYIRLYLQELDAGRFDDDEAGMEKAATREAMERYLAEGVPPLTGYLDSDSSDWLWRPRHNDLFDPWGIPWQVWEIRAIREAQMALGNLPEVDRVTPPLQTAPDRQRLEDRIALANARLEAGAPPVTGDSLYGMMESSLALFKLLSLLAIALAGSLIAGEFEGGTLYSLLTAVPGGRSRVFWAKARLLAEWILAAAGGLFVCSFLLGGLFGGFGGIADRCLTVWNGQVVRLPYFVVMVGKYLLFLLPVFAFGTLALMLSAVTRKTGVAITLSMALLVGSGFLCHWLAPLIPYHPIPGLKFLLIGNVQLDNYFWLPLGSLKDIVPLVGKSTPIIDHTATLPLSVAVLIVHILCFLWIARDSFCRREI